METLAALFLLGNGNLGTDILSLYNTNIPAWAGSFVAQAPLVPGSHGGVFGTDFLG